MTKLIINNSKVISEIDWSNFVSHFYGRPYRFQQQNGCYERGNFYLSVPSEPDCDMNDQIPETLETEEMGVKFEKWFERDPKMAVGEMTSEWEIALWWERNFFPDIQDVANDLYKRGELPAGEYVIDINW